MKKHLFKIRYIKLSAIALFTCCICLISTSIPLVATPDWIVRSNMSADLLLKAIAAENCEEKLAVSKSLQEINPAFKACRQKSVVDAVHTLEQKLARVKNPELRLDLEILLETGRQKLRGYELDEKYRVPYINLTQAILDSFKATLDQKKSPSEQQAILAKLEQYAGLEPGKIALTTSLEQKIQAQLQKSEVALPQKDLLKQDLNNNADQIFKIQEFLRQQQVPDYQEAYEALKTQLFDYETFIRSEVLTKAKTNFRLPTELYAFELQQQGIEIPIEELIQQARSAFVRTQKQMDEIAPEIARQKGIEVSGYREMIEILKQEQLSAPETLDLYQKRAKDLETIIEREDLVTLPQEEFDIRLATAQEKSNFPVPLYEPDSNTFVIPVFGDPKKAKLYNDFTNPAMSWTLTAHEGRPGHDLQFATIENQNLSRARTDFARNATSIEGWATYTESIMRPYMPLEGRFMSLQLQLLRTARAFLEPELQLGNVTTADALKVLTVDAGFSQFFAEQEIKRYTTRFPGQAPAYFYGSQQLLQLRFQGEKMLDEEFTPKKFHDFVLSQGFLTPKLLEQVLRRQWSNAINSSPI